MKLSANADDVNTVFSLHLTGQLFLPKASVKPEKKRDPKAGALIARLLVPHSESLAVYLY